MALRAIALNCSLKSKRDKESSSTDAMIDLVGAALARHGVELTETIRLVDHDVKPGVSSDEGRGDAWPAILRRILACDILIFGTPIWMGQMSSVAKRVLERMDGFLDETDDQGRTPCFGKLAVAAIVGNEDGAHAITASLFQALNDVGWTIPAWGACYWVGEAMRAVDFKDLEHLPRPVSDTAQMLAANAAHLAGLLQTQPYPGLP